MTCVVAVAKAGRVHMGCDSTASDGWRKFTRQKPKMVRVGEMLIGFAGSNRMAQILECDTAPPKFAPSDDPYHYLVKEFVPVVRKAFKDGGFATVDNGRERGGTFIAAVRGLLFVVESDFNVRADQLDYVAIGSGEAFALGSLHTTRGWEDPEARVRAALEAASDFCTTVGGPLHFETLNQS